MALRCLVGSVGLLLFIGFGTADAESNLLVENEVKKVFVDLNAGKLTAAQASNSCLLAMVKDDDVESLRQVLSTFLEVSRSKALPVLCDLLVKAMESGALRATDFDPIVDPQDKEAESFAVGRLLRIVYLAHNGLPPEILSGEIEP